MAVTLSLEGAIVPKARPRLGRGHAFLPERYRNWKDAAIRSFTQQHQGDVPIEKAEVTIVFLGSLRGDLDNLAGAILDVLVQSGVLKDDRLSCVPCLTVRHNPGKVKGAIVTIQKF